MRRYYFVATVCLLILAGCGYDPQQPVYDTTANPDRFAPAACELIDQIESGRLAEYEAIAAGFGQLYSRLPSMLDNAAWQLVVSRLGLKFRHQADSLVLLGSGSFTQAAGLYALASFARPDDAGIARTMDFFNPWRESPGLPPGMTLKNAPARLIPPLLRRFLLADSLHLEFARKHLMPPIEARGLNCEQIPEISTVDKAFLSYLGWPGCQVDSVMASFDHPVIELLAVAFTLTGENQYLAEMYFRPRGRIPDDLLVTLRIRQAKVSRQSEDGSETYVSIEITPSEPTSLWQIGRVAVVHQQIELSRAPHKLTIGLFRPGDGTFLSADGSDDGLVRIDLPAGTAF